MADSEIIFYGTSWCPDCHRAQRVFDQYMIGYRFINIDQDNEARSFVESVNQGMRSVPTIVFPEGDILVEPMDSELAERLEKL
ncbi:MAG TPA: glutaredoxin domain-containing protein [Anaerolineaceae bacterium]|nr:glutaredoxin domain-containing protein [Anaerolineaceae bacterium]